MCDLLKEKEMRGWGFSAGIWTNLPIQHCALALRLPFWVMEELGVSAFSLDDADLDASVFYSKSNEKSLKSLKPGHDMI